MTSVWTAGITWTTDTPISVDRLNAYVGLNGNIDYVLGNKGLQYVDYSGGNKLLDTATYSAFADTDATNHKVTVPCNLGRVMVIVQLSFVFSSTCTLGLDIFDSTNSIYASSGTGTPTTWGVQQWIASPNRVSTTLIGWFPSTTNNAVFKLRAKVSTNNTLTLTADANNHLKMWGFEH